jgi:hypothetical protein
VGAEAEVDIFQVLLELVVLVVLEEVAEVVLHHLELGGLEEQGV